MCIYSTISYHSGAIVGLRCHADNAPQSSTRSHPVHPDGSMVFGAGASSQCGGLVEALPAVWPCPIQSDREKVHPSDFDKHMLWFLCELHCLLVLQSKQIRLHVFKNRVPGLALAPAICA